MEYAHNDMEGESTLVGEGAHCVWSVGSEEIVCRRENLFGPV
jgi:hypothetical protein